MNFFDNIIKAKKNIANTVDLKSSMNIAFGIDSRFALGTGVLMTSIIKNNTTASIAFHIFTDKLHSDDINRLASLGQQYKNIAIYIYYIDSFKFQKFSTMFIWSQATYYRFIISHELSGKVERFLYLDADILCVNSLESLFSIDLKDNIAAVVADYETMVTYAKNSIGFTGDKYFNAGFLLIDVANWNKAAISEQAVSLLSKNDYKFCDQDVLNLLLTNKVLFLPPIYNTIYHLADMDKNITDTTVLLHYSGSVKPWQAWGQFHFLTPLWLKYQQLSPWKNAPIQAPKTYKQAKFMARTMKRTQKYPAFLKWLLTYIAWKIRDKIFKAKD